MVMDYNYTEINGTVLIDLHPTVTACQCDGMNCTTEGRKTGDAISICLWSNYLDISVVLDMMLRLDSLVYQPISNGTANSVTEVTMNGKSVIITTMIISAFFQDMDPSDLVVEGQVSFAPPVDDRRYLAAPADYSTAVSRSLALSKTTVFTFTAVCCLVTSVALAVAVGALIAKGYFCSCLSPRDNETTTQKTYPC